MDRLSPCAHFRVQPWVPYRLDLLIVGQRSRRSGAGGFVVPSREAPRRGLQLAHHEVSDADSGPVEITVVRQACTAGNQLPKQSLLGCSRHAVRADQRRTVRCQPIRGDGEYRWILANVYASAGNFPRRRVAQQYAQGEVDRFAQLGGSPRYARGHCIPRCGEVEAQNRRGELVHSDPEARPLLSGPFSFDSGLFKPERAEQQCRYRSSCIQGVCVSQFRGREVRERPAPFRQSPDESPDALQ